MSKERIMDSASPVEGVPVEDEKAGARVAIWRVTVEVPIMNVATPFVQGRDYWAGDPDVYLMAEATLRGILERAVNAATRDETSKDSTHDPSGEAQRSPLNQNLPPESEANNGTD